MIGLIVTFVAPMIMTAYLEFKFHSNTEAREAHKLLHDNFISSIFQSVMIFYLVFVSCWKSPSWWTSYVLVGPWIHAMFAIADFVLIPIYTIVQVIINRDLVIGTDDTKSKFGDYIVLQAVISVVVLIQLVWQLRGVIYAYAVKC